MCICVVIVFVMIELQFVVRDEGMSGEGKYLKFYTVSL